MVNSVTFAAIKETMLLCCCTLTCGDDSTSVHAHGVAACASLTPAIHELSLSLSLHPSTLKYSNRDATKDHEIAGCRCGAGITGLKVASGRAYIYMSTPPEGV